jgi:hypothetical protein
MIRHIQFLKFLKNIRKNPRIFITYFKYSLNIFLIKLLKLNFKSIPNLPKLFSVQKIDIESNLIEQAHNDIEIKKYVTLEKSNTYKIYDFNETYLKDVQIAWGYNRLKYIDFFEKKLGAYARKIFNGANYRIEHVWLIKSFKNSTHINTKMHTDGDMVGAVKVMIYLTDVDEESGPFTVWDLEKNKRKEITGKIGTVIFFNQNSILHAAAPNKSKDRIVLTFSLYPTLRNKIYYRNEAILNALYNFNPFTSKS